MTEKAREKFLYQKIKNLSKLKKWKFKSYFTFKKIENTFFYCNYSINGKTSVIYVYLEFKPFSIDDTFWEITDMPENSKMPLSFRGDAAFNVNGYQIFNFLLKIKDIDNPEKEINLLIDEINQKSESIVKKGVSVNSFLNILLKKNENYVGIITCLMELKKYEQALVKIYEYKKNEVNSGYGFGDKDFFDLIEEKCREKLNL
jgi:hypothetical protein